MFRRHAARPAGVGTEYAASANAPVVAFDRVSLAFDDHMVLRDVSFSVLPGHMPYVKAFLSEWVPPLVA